MKSLVCFLVSFVSAIALAAEPEILSGTVPLTMPGNLSEQMHLAALRDMDRLIAESPANRARYWKRDTSSAEAYARSIAPNREHFRKIIGLVDARVAPAMERFGDDENAALVADGEAFRISQVRWPVLERVTGEGLLLEPHDAPRGFVIAVPDADQTPEQIVGLTAGVKAEMQFARKLAANGFEVLVPAILDRSSNGSGNLAIAMTNLTQREWIHRQAYMMGRHVIGFEVQKISAAIDWWIKHRAADAKLAKSKVGVAGYGEGGLLAFYAAAADERIDAALVSGYFKSRQETWREPLYRNVWGLLREFGDAEIASLIAPRGLVVHAASEPRVESSPAPAAGAKDLAAPGVLTNAPFASIEAEFQRIETLVPRTLQRRSLFAEGAAAEALTAFAQLLGQESLSRDAAPLRDARKSFDPSARSVRALRELDDFIQVLVRDSDQTRNAFFLHKVCPEFANVPWNYSLQFPTKAPATFEGASREYRAMFWDEIIGRIDQPLPPLNPRTRLVYDTPKFTGYEVVLDTGAEGFAWGIVLLPKGMQPGERRPVVVCQHGRHGLPNEVIDANKPAYQNFAARLAEQGFITLAPHNLYQKEEFYRTLSRKGNTVKASMFSVILRHHQQWLEWLATLPNVDATRIGFYGLSYGGESAMRLPSMLEGYALSICSGDFNDWTRKVASTHDRKSFMFSDEWEMPYFGMGTTFSYAELSYLIFPRPFMVERGHHDGVALDPWVASEFAKTRWFYAQFGLADRAAIEFFNGGHAINGQRTFRFLREHLHWPASGADAK